VFTDGRGKPQEENYKDMTNSFICTIVAQDVGVSDTSGTILPPEVSKVTAIRP
jgi:hypothetical protein